MANLAAVLENVDYAETLPVHNSEMTPVGSAFSSSGSEKRFIRKAKGVTKITYQQRSVKESSFDTSMSGA